jgi:murein DD-endopeptidase MepM/ murein hydrolase activator NlpD
LKREILQGVDVQQHCAGNLESKTGQVRRNRSAFFCGTRSSATLGLAFLLAAIATLSLQSRATAAFRPLQGTSVVNVDPLANYSAEPSEVDALSAPTQLLNASELMATSEAAASRPTSSLKKVKEAAELDIDISQTIIPNHDQSALANAGAVVHKVTSGETLDEISKRYEVDAKDILKANGISKSGDLSDHEVLKIPTHQDQANTPRISLKVDEDEQIEDDLELLDAPALLAKGTGNEPADQTSTLPELSVPIAKRAIFPQIPELDLPPLSSVDTYLPDEMQSGQFRYIMPAKGKLTSGYGPRWGRMHRGIDIAAPVGTVVVASAPGVIATAGWNSGGYGNLVEVRHPDGSVTRYAHNNRITSQVGQSVRQGQKIAEMGSTGRSTGPHTHFEIRPMGQGAVNPMNLLNRG